MSQAENCVNLQDKTKLMFSSAASIIKSPGSSWPSYWALQAAEHGAGVAGAPSPTSKAASKCLERLRLCIIIYLQPLVCKFLEVKSTLQQPKNIDLRETPGLLNLSTEWWLYKENYVCLNWFIFGISLLNPQVFSAVLDRNRCWEEKHGPGGTGQVNPWVTPKNTFFHLRVLLTHKQRQEIPACRHILFAQNKRMIVRSSSQETVMGLHSERVSPGTNLSSQALPCFCCSPVVTSGGSWQTMG